MTDDNANVSADLASMMDVMLNMYSNAVDRLGVPTASGEEHGLKDQTSLQVKRRRSFALCMFGMLHAATTLLISNPLLESRVCVASC